MFTILSPYIEFSTWEHFIVVIANLHNFTVPVYSNEGDNSLHMYVRECLVQGHGSNNPWAGVHA